MARVGRNSIDYFRSVLIGWERNAIFTKVVQLECYYSLCLLIEEMRRVFVASDRSILMDKIILGTAIAFVDSKHFNELQK